MDDGKVDEGKVDEGKVDDGKDESNPNKKKIDEKHLSVKDKKIIFEKIIYEQTEDCNQLEAQRNRTWSSVSKSTLKKSQTLKLGSKQRRGVITNSSQLKIVNQFSYSIFFLRKIIFFFF